MGDTEDFARGIDYDCGRQIDNAECRTRVAVGVEHDRALQSFPFGEAADVADRFANIHSIKRRAARAVLLDEIANAA